MEKSKSLEKCPDCSTPLEFAPGIGPYCPNIGCDTIDDLDDDAIIYKLAQINTDHTIKGEVMMKADSEVVKEIEVLGHKLVLQREINPGPNDLKMFAQSKEFLGLLVAGDTEEEIIEDAKNIIPTFLEGHMTSIPTTEERVNHPAHYTQGKVEVIDFIETMGFLEGNIIKYVARYKHKNGLVDLKKARWYLDRLIENTKNENKSIR